MSKTNNTPHQLTDKVKLLQKVVLVADKKALVVCRRKNTHSRPGKWDLPGGNSEWPDFTESRGGMYQDDVIREVEEETGITLDKSVFDPNYLIYFDTYFEAEKQLYTIIANWWVELPDNFKTDSVKLSNEHTKYDWVTVEELELFDFGGAEGVFVRESIETALSYSQALDEELDHQSDHHHHAKDDKDGCCGGDHCGCNH